MANIKKIVATGKKIKLAKPAGTESPIKKVIAHYGKTEGISYSKAQKEIRSKQLFIVLGEKDCGNGSLLSIPGINYSCEYPSEESQLLNQEESAQIQWRFTSKCAWIQIPAAYLEAAKHDELLAFYRSLEQFKPQNSIDGIVFVSDVSKFIGASREELGAASVKYQKQLISLNRNIGVTPPIYFLFENTNRINGFDQIFGDESGRWDEQTLGSFITPEHRNIPVKDQMSQRFSTVTEQVRLIEIKMLVREHDDEKRRAVSKFASELLTLKSTVSDFITQFLTPVDSRDLNVLGGFFFGTIAENSKGKTQTYFIKPIFQDLLPASLSNVSHTTEKKKNLHRKTLVFTILTLLLLTLFFILLSKGSTNIGNWESTIAQQLTKNITYNADGIANLRSLHDNYISTSSFREGKSTWLMKILGYDPKQLSESVKSNYLYALQVGITVPAEKILRKELYAAVIDGSSDLANKFMPLKNTLRTYLACSIEGKKFPTLFDKEILIKQLTPIVVKQFYSSTTPSEAETEDIHTLIRSYVNQIESGNFSTSYKPQEKLVVKTQDRLVSLFDVEVVYETLLEQMKKKGNSLYLFDLVPEANEVNMNSAVALHEVYTPKAWKTYISSEISSASKRLNSVEQWVVGNNKERMGSSFTNPDKLYHGMVKFYLSDVKEQWLTFVKSIKLYRFNSLYEASHVMSKLGGSKSAIAKTFATFNGMVDEFNELGKSEKESELFLKFADSFKIFEEVINNMGAYQAYMKKTGAAISENRKTGTLSTVFNGSKNDPLYNLYYYTRKTMLPQLSSKDQAVVSKLLWQPYERTKKTLTKPITTELNKLWIDDVVTPFNKHFSGKYPFSSSQNNTDYSTVMEFFSPATGPAWKALNEGLSGYISKKNGKFSAKSQKGMVPVNVSPKVLEFYNRSYLIAKIFFSADGKEKVWRFTINPTDRTKVKSAIFTVGEVTGDVMIPGSAKFKWPEEKGYLSMKFTDMNGNPSAVQKHGEWTLMKEFNKFSLASVRERYINRFPAQFTVRAYAKQISLRTEVLVSSPNHPFSHNPFQGISTGTSFSK